MEIFDKLLGSGTDFFKEVKEMYPKQKRNYTNQT